MEEPTDLAEMGVESRRLLEAVAGRLFGDDGRGESVALGRYAILERLGQGAMGSVYRAYDPELRREVALKVVEDDAPAGSTRDTIRSRTLREAQVLARVSHPNVVAVHDVGITDDGVFLAMELVTGSDLRRWLEANPPGSRRRTARALAFVLQAVDGMAAAHAANVVHRDIKPANILIGSDGRVRVADFGLARHDTDLPSRDDTIRSAGGDGSVTRTGAVVGTPAYMPPEQLRGEPADRRSDVFSLCATAYELLGGVRPFAGKTMEALLAAIERDRPASMPAGARVPKAVERVIARGLAAEADRRWQTMVDLGAALRRAQGRTRRWTLGAGGVTVAGGAAMAAVLAGSSSPYERCAGQASRAAALVDDAAGDRLREHFVQTLDVGDEIHARTRATLDRHAEAWAEAFEQSCGARWRDATASPERFDATVRCLERNLGTMTHLVETLTGASREVVARAPAAALSLDAPALCHEPEPEGVEPPTDPSDLEHWEALRSALERARLSMVLGDLGAATELTGSTLEAVRAAGFVPLEARALLLQSELEERTGSPEKALAIVEDALWKAVEVGDHTTLAEATTRTAYVVGVELGRFEEGLAWTDRAAHAVSGAGTPPRLEWDRRFFRAAILNASGEYDQAAQILETLVAEEEDAEGIERLRLSSALRAYGRTLGHRGENEAADPVLRRALAIETEITGRWTQDASAILLAVGENLLRLARYDEARTAFEEALEIRRAVVGPDSIAVAEALQHGSIVAHLQSRHEDAEELGRQAHRISVAILGPEHPRSVSYGLDVVNAELGQERFEAALRDVEPLVAAGAAAWGADSPHYANLLAVRAKAHAGLHRLDAAATDLEAAIALRREKLGPTHPEVGKSLLTLGEVELERGRIERAIELLEEARQIHLDKRGPDHPSTRNAEDLLARARATRRP